MTRSEKQRRILAALKETRDFIAKEEPRGDDLRPIEMVELLASYKAHEQKLIGMLEAA